MSAVTLAEIVIVGVFLFILLRRFVSVKVEVQVDRVKVAPRARDPQSLVVSLERRVRRPLRWTPRSIELPEGAAGERLKALRVLGVESVEAGPTVDAALAWGLKPGREHLERIRAELEGLADALDA